MVPKEEVVLIASSDVLIPESVEDKELVLAFKRGEDGSYQAIYERYSPKVSGICRRLLPNPADADEARQETFMRVYTGLPNFNGRYQLGAWVSRIATNVCLDHLRIQKRRPADCADHDTLVALQDDSTDDDPEQLFIAADDHKKVRSILSSLSPMHRAAIALREFEGMSYGEIAVALGMTEPQVKALLHRARKSFRRSWMQAGLAALLPWKLIAKLRRAWEPAVGGHHPIADAAATSTIHFSTACSSVLASCGQFITERMAPVVTAVIFGGAAVASGVLPARDHARDHMPTLRPLAHAAAPASADAPERSVTKAKKKRTAPGADQVAPGPAPAPAPAPGREPEPTSTPPPAASGSQPQPAPTNSPADNKPQQNPAPTGPTTLSTYFGWAQSEPIPRAESVSSKTQLSCTTTSLTHSVESLISYGAHSYRVVLDVVASSTGARLEFVVWKDNRDIRYSSRGRQPLATWSSNGNQRELEITGEYGALHGYDPDAAHLPASGSFNASLTLDCVAQSVVTERATFTTQ